MNRSLVVTGAHVVCRINGRVIGRVTSFRWGRQRTVRPAQGVDVMLPSELIPGAWRFNVQMTLVYTRRDGGAEGAGLVPPTQDITREQYVTLELRDRTSDSVIAASQRSLLSGESWDAVTKDILRGSVSLDCLDLVGLVRPRGG